MLRSKFFPLITLLNIMLIFHACGEDVIRVKDGSTVNGRIEGMQDGKLKIDTSFAGTILVDINSIDEVSTDKDVNVAYRSGNTLFGRLQASSGTTRIHTVNGELDVSNDQIVAVWRKGQDNPLQPTPDDVSQTRRWQYEANGDIRGKTGNTEKFRNGGGLKATLASPDDKLLMYIRGENSRDDGKKTVEELFGGIDYEAAFSDRQTWYTRIELEHDDIEQVDLRTTVAAGYGYLFVKRDDKVLRGRVGIQFRHESFQKQESNSAPGLDLGLHHMMKSKRFGTLTNDIVYNPSFEDFGDYRVYHESSLQLPLLKSKLWSLKFGLSNEYNSTSGKGIDNLDTHYFSRFVLTWD